MFRFVVLTWNDADARASAAAQRVARRLTVSSPAWRRSLNTSGFMVFYADARQGLNGVYPLAGNHGVVLGKLFGRRAHQASIAATLAYDVPEADAIVASAGRRLVEEYWGRYVGFLRDRNQTRTWIVRDPTGDLPCYHSRFESVNLYFSCAEDLASLDLLTFAPNWDYIAAFMCYPTRVQSAETGLDGVSEIQPGECWETERDQPPKKRLLWNPVELAQADAIEVFQKAVTAVRETTQMCIWSWAESHPRIVHLLSGGLDSSIVLACLHTAPSRPEVTCINYFDTTSPAGDEREYARMATSAAGCRLVETGHGTTAPSLQTVLDISRSVKPYLMQYYLNQSRFEGDVAREANATALSYGNGGDQIFYQNPIIEVAADYAYRHAVGPRFLRLAARIAGSSGVSFWTILRHALRKGLLRSTWHPLSGIGALRMLLVKPDVIDAVLQRTEYLVNPRLVNVHGVPPGKLEHVRMIWSWRDFFDPLETDDYPQRIRPLVSQPLIELCLRIPTYVLAADGYDRAVARRAFAPELPRRIATRRTKGIIDSSLSRLLRANWDFLQEMMLDGALVREGLLDRRKVADLFAHGRASFGAEAQEIVVLHLSTEAWLRSWTAKRSLKAAVSN